MRKMWGNLKFYIIMLNFSTSPNYLKSLILVFKTVFHKISLFIKYLVELISPTSFTTFMQKYA